MACPDDPGDPPCSLARKIGVPPLMSDAEIELFLRPDYPVKSGGDLVLAREYESALTTAGHAARLRPLSAEALASGTGSALLFNIDRYFEFVASAAALRRAGRSYVVAPVHHPTAYVDRFERDRRPSALKAVATVGRTPFGRERIKHAIRGRSAAAIRECSVLDARSAVREALRAAAAIVVQAPAELEQLEQTFGADVRARSTWVPNGVTLGAAPPPGAERDIDLLVAGRIEERKNQLAIAEAFAGGTTHVTFVGADNRRNAAYAAEFHALVDRHQNLHHFPHVSLEELRSLYARSKVLFSASRFEVVSLAELEAVAYGCRLVSTTSGYMRDYLGDLAEYIDPTGPTDAWVGTAQRVLEAGPNTEGMELVRRTYSWERSHAALVGAYRAAALISG